MMGLRTEGTRQMMVAATVLGILVAMTQTPVAAELTELPEAALGVIVGTGGASHWVSERKCKGPNYPASDCQGCFGPFDWDEETEVWITCHDPHGFRACQHAPEWEEGCWYYDWLICSPTTNIYVPYGPPPYCRPAYYDADKSPSTRFACVCLDCCDVAPY